MVRQEGRERIKAPADKLASHSTFFSTLYKEKGDRNQQNALTLT
jgi:hypothetical protein